ncbi:MAG: undecaprenyldiphospho-muramoylpentapeptide beta-N-acetylglucosaminyltransferase [Proteobacteria bacterium]|nr:undecaprenyldiphospho-muramoylpentapeptide beta-N-acetylglucosaminyltransferase [Pseudomonadota bacterium]
MRLVMAGGGTGGHLFPALALADEFKAVDHNTEIIFIGARGRLEEKIVPSFEYPLEVIEIEAIKNKSGLGWVKALLKAMMATVRSMKMLRRIKPDGVIGSGSYASGPVVLAAKILGIKTALLEQNILPGITNKFLAKFVNRAYFSFKESEKLFRSGTRRLSGTPIRREILECRKKSKSPLKGKRKFTILVFGGSQGATTINATFLDAADYLSDIWNDLRIIHQSGAEGYRPSKDAYERKGLSVELHKFIDDMAEAYSDVDLVVCRAGATSIAEITALGLASIMMPYPFASAGHQEVNARYLESRGAASMITQEELTASNLSAMIKDFYEDRVKLKGMAEKSAGLGRPQAARFIVDDFSALLKGAKRA